jgi:hypothetical protein
VILDRDAKFDQEVILFLKATGLTAKRTKVQSPWQNGTAERWVGSCRLHDSLAKDAPEQRAMNKD